MCNGTLERDWGWAHEEGGWPKARSGTANENEQGEGHLNNLNKRLSAIAEMSAV